MVDFDVEFCPHCGYELNYVGGTCPACGSDVPEYAEYCPGCGDLMEHDFYMCSRCFQIITKEEVDTLNAMSFEESVKHIRELNRKYEEQEQRNESELEEHQKQKEINYAEVREKLARQKKAEEELAKEVETLLMSKVDNVKSVKILPAKIEAQFIKASQTYKLIVLKENWKVALPRLLDSLEVFPSDIKSYTFERQ